MLLRLHTALTVRVRELLSPPTRDAGEGPVPYIIMVALMAIGAFGIAMIIRGIATNWTTKIPTQP